MRLWAPGVRLFTFRVHNSTDSALRNLHRLLGTRCLIGVLRGAAVAVTVPMLMAIACAMWSLSATVDAVLAGSAATAWTLWLDRDGGH